MTARYGRGDKPSARQETFGIFLLPFLTQFLKRCLHSQALAAEKRNEHIHLFSRRSQALEQREEFFTLLCQRSFCQVKDRLSSRSYFIRAAIAREKLSLHKSEWQWAKNLFSNLIDFRSRCSCAAGHEKKYKPACRWFHSQNRARQEKTQEMEMANLIYGVLGQNFRRESARQVEGDRNDMTCSPACPKISRESFLRPESQG